MKKDWIKIFSTTQLYEANVIEALLKENDIIAFIMNKQDSSYGILLPGRIDVYIPEAFEKKAKLIINDALTTLN